jgi:nucleoside-diphosphate-sugar epimerase
MRVFVTGASGWIGSAVVPELLEAGHEVVGLARSEASAQRLEAAGVMVRRGDVDDPDGLAKAAADSDGVIHLAFQHEVAFGGNFAAAAAADRRAVEAMGAALADSDRPFVLASGVLGLTAGRVSTEDDGLVPSAEVRGNPAGRRSATALLTLSAERHRRPLVGAALPADGPRRRRPRVRGHPRWHRPPAGRGRIHR